MYRWMGGRDRIVYWWLGGRDRIVYWWLGVGRGACKQGDIDDEQFHLPRGMRITLTDQGCRVTGSFLPVMCRVDSFGATLVGLSKLFD